MYYEPNSRVTVGNVVFNNVNRVQITESVKELGDKAIVVLPRNYSTIAGQGVLDYLKTGDPVKIELGYDGNYWTEFSGFLDEIESSEPLVLHIDDAFYHLKRNNFVKAWPSISLKQLLEFIAPNYTIECPGVNLGTFQISNASSYRVLRELQKQYGFYSYIRDQVITCQFAYDVRGIGDIWTYKFYNNVKRNDLAYHRKEDVKVRIKAIANQRNGKKLKYETGSDDVNYASVRTLNFGAITEKELKQAADAWYNKLSFDGYSGSITGFAYPRTHAGDTLKIIDDLEPEREGNYLIEKTIIVYDLTKGYERQNTLSFKV
ncbi:hypothetical protein [Saccharicrinis fermentans]|uniref:Phage protein D n=1 Tax=Saccharicrinis fermentans DSM 9555 = JCM 21142 TaxID=869213 RepID=W7YT31_9BACT|nr:hypothetical protein [Saccharicrinis fermentans]GAF05599.1 phage protein D [Saccharicrinis fermentans DSM 9555 = JCM 21142]